MTAVSPERLSVFPDPVRLSRTPAVARVLDRTLSGAPLTRDDAVLLITSPERDVPAVCAAARALRARGKGRGGAFSPKGFVPLTQLWRGTCGYCPCPVDP